MIKLTSIFLILLLVSITSSLHLKTKSMNLMSHNTQHNLTQYEVIRLMMEAFQHTHKRAPHEFRDFASRVGANSTNLNATLVLLSAYSESFHPKLTDLVPGTKQSVIYNRIQLAQNGTLNATTFESVLENYFMAAAWNQTFHNGTYVGRGSNGHLNEHIVDNLADAYRGQVRLANILFNQTDVDRSGSISLKEFSQTDVLKAGENHTEKFNSVNKGVKGEMTRQEFQEVKINDALVSADMNNSEIYRHNAQH